jgi:hypothetical protein
MLSVNATCESAFSSVLRESASRAREIVDAVFSPREDGGVNSAPTIIGSKLSSGEGDDDTMMVLLRDALGIWVLWNLGVM